MAGAVVSSAVISAPLSSAHRPPYACKSTNRRVRYLTIRPSSTACVIRCSSGGRAATASKSSCSRSPCGPRSWALRIPRQAGHPFHGMPVTDSTALVGGGGRVDCSLVDGYRSIGCGVGGFLDGGFGEAGLVAAGVHGVAAALHPYQKPVHAAAKIDGLDRQELLRGHSHQLDLHATNTSRSGRNCSRHPRSRHCANTRRGMP